LTLAQAPPARRSRLGLAAAESDQRKHERDKRHDQINGRAAGTSPPQPTGSLAVSTSSIWAAAASGLGLVEMGCLAYFAW
jgi:hypothetical protein